MGQGYTRNDASNNIANGNVINASDLDGEFDAIVNAFASGTGHTHDGTAAEGGAITVVGPAQEYIGDGTALYPKLDATYDLGKTASSFNVAYIESLNLGGTVVTGGTSLGVSGNITVTGTVDGRDVATDGTKLDGVASGAEVNQNAFSNIAVSGQTTVAADGKTDTLTLAAGSNITLTTDAATDTVTITAASGTPSTADVLSATAGATAGDVGTYAFLISASTLDVTFGSTLAGSNLRPSGVTTNSSDATVTAASLPTGYVSTQNTTQVGTWRCMGIADYTQTGAGRSTVYYRPATLWLRIS